MGVSKEDLANIIATRAARLCTPEGDRRINEHIDQSNFTKQGMGGGYAPSVSDYDDDAEKWDAMFSDNAGEDYADARDIQYSEYSAKNSNLPDNIKKSMLEHRIDTSALGGSSVLDSLGVKGNPQKRKTIAESRQAQPQYVPSAGSVDYSIIKAIVSECIRDYFSSQPLNEGALKTISLKGGTISLVDNSGNIYKAKLEKVGNANDKK